MTAEAVERERVRRRDYMRKVRAADPAAARAQVAAWRAANPERSKEHQRRYYETHTDQRRLGNWVYAIKWRYGITQDQYLAMLEAQGGVCAICGNGNGKMRLAVDHDHVTGRVRGLLCGPCNRYLGRLNDRPEAFEAIAEYLREPR